MANDHQPKDKERKYMLERKRNTDEMKKKKVEVFAFISSGDWEKKKIMNCPTKEKTNKQKTYKTKKLNTKDKQKMQS